MYTPATSKIKDHLADSRALEQIEDCLMRLAGTGNLTPRARQALCLCVAAIRKGYTGISACMDAISRTIYRLCGQARSVRSAFRAFAELEKAGFIIRQKFRIGPDHFVSKIRFNLAKFAYWTCGKVSHISSSLPDCQQYEVTSEGVLVNSRNLSPNVEHKPARVSERYVGGGKPQKEQGGKTRVREHPIVFTLRCIVRGSNRRYIIARAEVELTSRAMRTSGADLDKWEPAWTGLSIPEREIIAREQLVPYLAKMQPAPPLQEGGGLSAILSGAPKDLVACPPEPQARAASPETISGLLSDTPIGEALSGPFEGPGEVAPELLVMGDKDRKILERARASLARARAARARGTR